MAEVERVGDEVRLRRGDFVERVIRIDRAGGVGVRMERRLFDDEAQLEAFLEAGAAELERRAVNELRCDFCQKAQNEVDKLIAGPRVYICDECVTLCGEILAEG